MYDIGMRLGLDQTDGEESNWQNVLFFAVVGGLVVSDAMRGKNGKDKVLGLLRTFIDRKEADELYDDLLQMIRRLPAPYVLLIGSENERLSFAIGTIGGPVDEDYFTDAKDAIAKAETQVPTLR